MLRLRIPLHHMITHVIIFHNDCKKLVAGSQRRKSQKAHQKKHLGSDVMTYVISSSYCLGHRTIVVAKVGLVIFYQEHVIIVIL